MDILVKEELEDPSASASEIGSSSVGVDGWWRAFEAAGLHNSRCFVPHRNPNEKVPLDILEDIRT